MFKLKYKLIALTMVVLLFSCTKPRIELDNTQWGDKADIINVELFKLDEIAPIKLNYNDPVPGVLSVNVRGSQTIDKAAKQVKLVANAGTDLKKVGIRISNDALMVEPQNGAPTAGYIRDFSAGPYVYRLISADGTVKDWSIIITVAP